MKKILTLLVLLLPVMVFGQSKQSDEYYNKGVELYNAKKYAEAIECFEKSVELEEKEFDSVSSDYNRSNIQLAHCWIGLVFEQYKFGHDYSEAFKLRTKALEICKKTFGEESPNYAWTLHHFAIYEANLANNYPEAIRLVTQALEIRKKVFGEEHETYISSLNSLIDYNVEFGNYLEAIRLATFALESIEDDEKKNTQYCAATTWLNELANCYYELGNYSEAIKFGTKAIKSECASFVGKNYATLLYNLAVYNSCIGNYSEAIKLCSQVLEILKKKYTENSYDFIISLRRLASYNFYAGNYIEATELFSQTYNRTESLILKTFSYLTYKERSDFWNQYSDFFSYSLPFCAYKQPNSTLKTLAYNGQLLSKGLNLNAELEIQRLIEQSGDTTFANRYDKIRSDRAMLDKLYQVPLNKRQMNADSLLKEIDKEEKLLVESSKELGDYTKNLSIKLDDVQKRLNDSDIAIEFADFYDEGEHIYIALVLKKGMSVPELVKLDFSETDSALYKSIWQPLEKYLNGVKNVYFSPCGKFHTIAIEYLPDETGEIFAKKYNAFRLSSTRELALEKKNNPNKKAAVYGGIIYDYGEDNWLELKKGKDEIEHDFRDFPLISSKSFRNGATFLQGTKIEAEKITELLRSANYVVSENSDIYATEESFKKLSGSGIKILHIGTHGFYQKEDTVKHTFSSLLMNDRQPKEDLSLSQSGLLLAGANSALDPEKQKDIPEGVDDGILTAKEISRLDFKGLDLVVLSACQTGLGEVTSEGVFGLQRGFKKAGAQTIVMSLWKVADDATQLLMTEFFKNLTSGQTKRGAFLAAQEIVRQKYPDPKYWAAFVMVDGME